MNELGDVCPLQEQTESLDDDEDRQNPAYIPRRGAFYEHDTRISDDVDPKEDPRYVVVSDSHHHDSDSNSDSHQN